MEKEGRGEMQQESGLCMHESKTAYLTTSTRRVLTLVSRGGGGGAEVQIDIYSKLLSSQPGVK